MYFDRLVMDKKHDKVLSLWARMQDDTSPALGKGVNDKILRQVYDSCLATNDIDKWVSLHSNTPTTHNH